MMPVSTTNESEEFPEAHVDYKQKYKALKKKLRLLVYEQECFLDELRKAQRKLLKVTRDRSFLLDRLLQHEKVEDSSDESDATNSTDTDEGHREAGPAKRKKLAAQTEVSNLQTSSAKHGSSGLTTSGGESGSKKKNKSTKKANKSGKLGNQKASAPVPKESPGQMTREELERHLDSKQHEFCIEKATASLPMEIFSNDPNHDSDGGDAGGEEEEDDLIIDVPH